MTDDKALSPVFILAPPRSYTSLFSASLGQHPALFGMPELNLFQAVKMEDFWSGLDENGVQRSPFWHVMRHGLLRAVAQLYLGEQTYESVRAAERWVRTRATMTSGEVYRELAQKLSPRRIVEKSPGYLRKEEYLERLLETFPQARFIHLVRHPMGQCLSSLKAKGGKQLLFMLGAVDYRGAAPVLDPQIVWHDSQIRIMNFLEQLPVEQWVRIRGEDFIMEPAAVLQQICRWLEISDTPEVIEAMLHPEASPFSCEGPANARLGNDINFLQNPSLTPGRVPDQSLQVALPWRVDGATFHPRVIELAQELGYESCVPVHAERTPLAPLMWGGRTLLDGGNLRFKEVMKDPKLRSLGEALLKQMREDFAADQPENESAKSNGQLGSTSRDELEKQKQWLEYRADILDAMLEETIASLEQVNSLLRDA